MNTIAHQLRTNAKAILVPHAKDNMPEAAIAGALEMGAGEIERLDSAANAWNRVVSKMMEVAPTAFDNSPSPLEGVLTWIEAHK